MEESAIRLTKMSLINMQINERPRTEEKRQNMKPTNLRKLVTRLKEIDDKLESLIEIKNVLSEIENNIDEGTPNFELYKSELIYHCESLVGINDGNNHGSQQHYAWALAAIDKLESKHCLDFKSCQISL